jgi:hypothetical protein
MARHTRIRVAALATSLVAALGILAMSPATSADAGKSPAKMSYKIGQDCC